MGNQHTTFPRTISEYPARDIPQIGFDDLTGSHLFLFGFLWGKLGRKIPITYVDATTERYEYYDGATKLAEITITYTDATKDNISQIERTG